MTLLDINTKEVKSMYKEASVLCSHCSTINNSQHTESNYPKLDEWVVTTWDIHTMYHKQGHFVVCGSGGEPGPHYTK